MPSFDRDFKWQRGFQPEVRRALGEAAFAEADLIEDRHHNTDFAFVLAAGKDRIGSRIRRNKYARHPYLDQFTIRCSRPRGTKTEYAKIREGWGDYLFYGFASINGMSLMRWFLGSLKIFRDTNPAPHQTKENADNSSDFHAFRLQDLPPAFIVYRGSAPAQTYDVLTCPLCERTGYLPSGFECDHKDHDGQRLAWINHFRTNFPLCDICQKPMVAGQKGHHLSCGTK